VVNRFFFEHHFSILQTNYDFSDLDNQYEMAFIGGYYLNVDQETDKSESEDDDEDSDNGASIQRPKDDVEKVLKGLDRKVKQCFFNS